MSEAYCIVRVRICKDGTLYFLADSWALYSRVLCLPSDEYMDTDEEIQL